MDNTQRCEGYSRNRKKIVKVHPSCVPFNCFWLGDRFDVGGRCISFYLNTLAAVWGNRWKQSSGLDMELFIVLSVNRADGFHCVFLLNLKIRNPCKAMWHVRNQSTQIFNVFFNTRNCSP